MVNFRIRDVWASNLEEELGFISDIVLRYPYVAMDTEFPGSIFNPVGNFANENDKHYHALKQNVNMLKLIQLGLTFSDANGNLPVFEDGASYAWQFNFREFNPRQDPCVEASMAMLRRSRIDLEKNNNEGVDSRRFVELLTSSGVVMNPDITWVTFHGGIDFGYLLKSLTGRNLPDRRADFESLMRVYFPVAYDIKHMINGVNRLHGGLEKVGALLGVARVAGVSHQAGSDSLLTSSVFFRLRDADLRDANLDDYVGVLYGLGN